MLTATMTVTRRKRLLSIGTFGTLLTALVLTADWGGKLSRLERGLHDFRVTKCQFFAGPPTDKLIHVDIDDGALAQVGQWPWDRSQIAGLVDELNLAGARAIVLDILFSEAKEPELRRREDGTVEQVDHDQVFADTIRRAGNVVLAASLNLEPPAPIDRLRAAAEAELAADCELTASELVARLERRGDMPADFAARANSQFHEARARAMAAGIDRELDQRSGGGGDVSADELARRLLPKASAAAKRTRAPGPLLKQFHATFEQVAATRAVRRFTIAPGPDTPTLIVADGGQLPIARIGEAAPAVAFVNYLPESDGTVRCLPLAVSFKRRPLPQIGLAAACMAMGVDVRDVRLTADEVIIPRPGAAGDVRIPTRAYPERAYAGTGTFFDVPVFGEAGANVNAWERMYDIPQHRDPKLRMGVLKVIEARDTRENTARLAPVASKLLLRVLRVLDPDQAEEVAAAAAGNGGVLPLDVLQKRAATAAEELTFQLNQLRAVSDPTPTERAAIDELTAVERDGAALRKFASDESLARLREQVQGRVVFVGSVATGAADFVPNSIDPRCPGVYLHSATFNAIMTGEFWRTAPRWVAYLITIAIGALTTLAIFAFDPPKAFAAMLLLAGGYAVVNGVVLFDRYNLIVGAAGPLLASAAVWSGVTLLQYVREIGERARLTRRFSSYVDPTLVNYVIENPEQARLEAHEKELTVVFTDLAGFTTLSEKLRAQSAKMLGQYMEAMVPLIRARRGYVNKFLGDGIMFFFGAPVENPDHAADAVAAVLDMEKALVPFNADLERQGLPTLSMRAGVTTGMMVVGDAGPSFASDYTVLGDAVNLAARLEGANKAFGTNNLITARTVELLKDRYVVRPIADLLVVGKEQSVFVHEAIAPAETATDAQRQLAALTAEMVSCFSAGKFDDCLRAAAELERAFGATKLTARYIEESQSRRGLPPDPAFRGKIQLISK
jgi:class 3 adenylate cyclase/CHASE2 domain-containing sensor protein